MLARHGLGEGYEIDQHTWGAQLRIAGDAVHGQDSCMQPIQVGLQDKTTDRGALVTSLGAQEDEGIDVYTSATKLAPMRRDVVTR